MKLAKKDKIALVMILIFLVVGVSAFGIGKFIKVKIPNTTSKEVSEEKPKIKYAVREMTNEEYEEIGNQALKGASDDLNDNQKRTLKRAAIYEAIYNNEASGYMNTLKITDTEKREYINNHKVNILKVKVDEKGNTLDYLLEGATEESDVTYRDVTDEDYLMYAERELAAELTVNYITERTNEITHDNN